MGVIAGNKRVLDKEYRKDGYLATYIKHKGDVYMYERVAYLDDNNRPLDNPIAPHYEVVVPIKQYPPARERAAGNTEPYPAYPRESDWGYNGWTLGTRERAEQKFNEIKQKRNG